MWIEAEDKHYKIVDARKLDTMYICYRRSGEYAIIGVIANRDIALTTRGTESDAEAFIKDLQEKLNID